MTKEKMNCPEDADTTEIGMCVHIHLNGIPYLCTRKKGHKGEHHAHGPMPKGKCHKVWR